MALEEYRRKRRFDATREPEGGKGRRNARPMFVVQLHHASRRHYDFRLQVGDVLRSWAVPKGPSFDPAVKRMAVEVEDHPLDYAGFEGDIPKGQYGGGHVARFDIGTWTTEGDVQAQLAKGHLRFELHGERLKGGWHLVRSGKPARQPQWLLFKQDDAWAGELEADDLLDGVTPPPVADARRAGTGKPPAASRKGRGDKKAGGRTPASAGPDPAAGVDWRAAARALPGASKRAMPVDPPAPQLARLVDAPPEGDGWLHELKWDGYRLLCTVRKGKVRLWSRNALDWSERVPEVRDAVAALGLDDAVFDGELVAGTGSREDFNLLQAVLSGERQGQLRYVLFDLLRLQGFDLAKVPLVERKALLERLLQRPPAHLAYSSHGAGHGAAALEAAIAAGFEGIISKRADAPSHPGRGDDWRKAKALDSAEFAVVGYTPPKGSRQGIGSLLLATPDPVHGWRYVGRVGSGLGDAQLRALGEQLKDAGSASASVFVPENDTDLRHARWLPRPAFVVEVFTRGTGGRGLLRQASFKALRPDKDIAALADSDRDPPAKGKQMTKSAKATTDTTDTKTTKATKTPKGTRTAKAAKAATAKAARTGRTKAAGTKPATKVAKVARLAKPQAAATLGTKTVASARTSAGKPRTPPALTSPDKLLYPDDGLRKRDLADYYAAVMDWLLPEIAGRPLSLVRCPGGIGAQCFFQKHATPGLELVSRVPIVESDGGSEDYLLVEDAASVMELVQFNSIEFHPWGSRAADVERADRLVFDLDPDPSVPWKDVVAAARQVRGYLQAAGLQSFVRTTGGKGLHVVVPLAPAVPWERARAFAQAVAEAAREMEPLRYVATASKKQRKGRIFIDWLRNGRGATSVASFSARARPGAPVSMPLRWEELGRVASGDAFDIRNAPARLKRLKSHPWAGIDAVRQGLPD